MAHMTITISLDSFKHREDETCEVVVALHDLASICRTSGIDGVDARRVQDSNGNQIGEVRVIRGAEVGK